MKTTRRQLHKTLLQKTDFLNFDIFKATIGLFLGLLVLTSSLSASSFYCSKKNSKPFQLLPVNTADIQNVNKEDYSLWFRDSPSRDLKEQHFFLVKDLLVNRNSDFQEYTIIDTEAYGKVLYIDGEMQSAEKDEFLYHESFVHPAMVAHPCPKNVLVIGAGEGAAAREILRHPTVERVVLVDIDEGVVQASKDYLSEWHQGSFDNPKVELVIMDGKQYVENTLEKFDVVFIDVCDQLADSPVMELYSTNFYNSLKGILTPDGIVTVQAMQLEPTASADHLIVLNALQEVFPFVNTYAMYIPSFYSTWGFVIASKCPMFSHLSCENVDLILSKRQLQKQLKHYDGETHTHMFSLSKALRTALKS